MLFFIKSIFISFLNIFFLPINISKTLITTSAYFLFSFFLVKRRHTICSASYIYLSVSPSFLSICLYLLFYLSVSTFFFICLYLLFYLSLPSFLSVSTFFFYLSHLFYLSVSTFFLYLSLPSFYLKNNLSFLQQWFVSFFLTIVGFKWTFDKIKQMAKKKLWKLCFSTYYNFRKMDMKTDFGR